ncbi:MULTISPECIES: helix-turn-helix domain-containing protein [Brevibacillus]|uniref:helix-turn-helix domain-containing protein n=1 Tax=Brevibacillus TaxID=55080 RepID=UPI0020422D78|nr:MULTISPECIES: helix-turn-helix domain-containing protein [Brevibacillus]MCM3625257.1 helix-turn-helix domain-containing protein [Brevibacillus borstelensis]MDH4620037.1 Rrf2 family transcriptional regulator [Brevibacillus sp. AY1]
MVAVAAVNTESRPVTKVEAFFRLLYGEHMRDYPRQRVRKAKNAPYSYDKNRPWVYVGQADKMRPAATLSTLFGYLWDETKDTTYYTPNSFYRSDSRREEYARWVHAFALDIDVKNEYAYQEGITLPDVFDRIEAAGLPLPTAVIRTPSGGFQPVWMLSAAVRATPKVRVLFTAIQRHMAQDVGADLRAVGVERIFRTPTESNLVYFEQGQVYDFQIFVDWREINHPLVWDNTSPIFKNYDIMDHPAIVRLYNQDAEIGKREASCLTLILAMKFSGWPMERTMAEMEKWWHECCEKGGSRPFTLKDVVYRVKRTYRQAKLFGPGAEIVRQLTGIDFEYKVIRFYTAAKSREQRKYTHKHEWKADLLALLQKENGALSGSLAAIAERLGCAMSSLKNVLADLQNEGAIVVQSTRGRNGSTSIALAEQPHEAFVQEAAAAKTTIQKNSQIDNTIGEAVGGAARVVLPGSPAELIGCLAVLNSPYPSSLPLYLTDLYRDTVAVWASSADPDSAQDAAIHTWLLLKKTLMACLRATKRQRLSNLTAYVRKSMSSALASLLEQGFHVDRLPASVRRQLSLEEG